MIFKKFKERSRKFHYILYIKIFIQIKNLIDLLIVESLNFVEFLSENQSFVYEMSF